MRVSKTWQATIQNYPQVWAVIDYRMANFALADALSRSRSQPLEIIWAEGGQTNDFFRSELLRNAERWQSIDGLLDEDEDLLAFETVEASGLKRLHLSCPRKGGLRAVNLFGGFLPELRFLFVTGISLDWASATVPRLRSLTFTQSAHNSGQQILEIIRICRESLRDLNLQYLAFDDEHSFEDHSSAPVNLPCVTKLALHGLTGVATRWLTNHLEILRCQRFFIGYPANDDDPSSTSIACTEVISCSLEAFAATSGHIIISLSHGHNVNITSRLRQSYDQAQENETDIEISLGRLSTTQILLDWIPVLLQRPTLRHVTVEIAYDESFHSCLSSSNHLAVLSRIPSIQKLTLDNVRGNLDGFIGALADPVVAEDGSWRWLCPELHTLSFSDCIYSTGAMLRLVQRWRGGAEPEGRTPNSQPALLQNFELLGSSPVDYEIFDSLEAILGNDQACISPGQRVRRDL